MLTFLVLLSFAFSVLSLFFSVLIFIKFIKFYPYFVRLHNDFYEHVCIQFNNLYWRVHGCERMCNTAFSRLDVHRDHLKELDKK